MTQRPYFQKSTGELEKLFQNSPEDIRLLKAIARELRHRRSQVAYRLEAMVQEAMARLCAPALEVRCSACSHSLHLAQDQLPGSFSCPACGESFRAFRSHGMITLVYESTQEAQTGSRFPQTIDEAYSALGLPRNAEWASVEQARRQLMQQYHPDKVMSLGPKLRALAETEAKIINVAYEMLRRTQKAASSA